MFSLWIYYWISRLSTPMLNNSNFPKVHDILQDVPSSSRVGKGRALFFSGRCDRRVAQLCGLVANPRTIAFRKQCHAPDPISDGAINKSLFRFPPLSSLRFHPSTLSFSSFDCAVRFSTFRINYKTRFFCLPSIKANLWRGIGNWEEWHFGTIWQPKDIPHDAAQINVFSYSPFFCNTNQIFVSRWADNSCNF